MKVIAEKDLLATMDASEKVIFSLRAIYRRAGYTQYTMGKFEEYDLYSKNKDFLISDGVITFTDTNGKLLALKPDVTLSIVKNHKDAANGVEKLCYNESVYRISQIGGNFREISQTGIECLGKIGIRNKREVLALAEQSLALISDNYRLQVCDLDILEAFIEHASKNENCASELRKCAKKKSTQEIEKLCAEYTIPAERCAPLIALLKLRGEPGFVLPKLKELIGKYKIKATTSALEAALGKMSKEISLDFSLTANNHFYNGIVFQGFIDGIPSRVLSGGQYDNLMARMGKKSHAIGFAVYVDTLSRYLRGGK